MKGFKRPLSIIRPREAGKIKNSRALSILAKVQHASPPTSAKEPGNIAGSQGASKQVLPGYKTIQGSLPSDCVYLRQPLHHSQPLKKHQHYGYLTMQLSTKES
jgi:hypothetical protein